MFKPVLSTFAVLMALTQPLLAQTAAPPTDSAPPIDFLTTDSLLLPAVIVQRDPLFDAVAAALPPMIGKENSDLVGRLMSVKPEGMLSRSFDPAVVSRAVFGRSAPTAAPDCRVTTTPQKETDAGLCVLDVGQRDDATGAYSMLAYSKNIGLGQIAMIKRAAFTIDGAPAPTPATISDEKAYAVALAFVNQLGLSTADIPAPPTDVKAPLPVRTLAAGMADEKGNQERRALRKVVSLQRAFLVPGGVGDFLDVNGKRITLNHVVAPGTAQVSIDDKGVQMARVSDWADPQLDSSVDPRQAKSNVELVEEITTELHNHGIDSVGTLSVLIALRQAMPNPDDPNPPLCPACGVLRPALRVIASQSGPTRAASLDKQIVAPGVMFEVDLTHQAVPERAVR
jgi:hypothetical protein